MRSRGAARSSAECGVGSAELWTAFDQHIDAFFRNALAGLSGTLRNSALPILVELRPVARHVLTLAGTASVLCCDFGVCAWLPAYILKDGGSTVASALVVRVRGEDFDVTQRLFLD